MNFASKLMLASALLLGTINADAAAPAQWYWRMTVKSVYAGQAGARTAVVVSPSINFGDCPAYEMYLDTANPHYKTILMLVTASLLSGKTVNVYTNGQCSTFGVYLTDVSLGDPPQGY
jgi:hypothetical protein